MTRTVEAIRQHYADVFGATYALVPGEGNAHAQLALVGEAPGAQEALQGRPFVGAAGKNLDAFLAGVGLSREDLYITNAVKFRPTREGKTGRLSNRTPTRKEVALFRPWLLEELTAVGPRVVATLGNTALRAVTGTDGLVIGDVHGQPLPTTGAFVVFPLYHPASVIYNRALQDTYAEDLGKLRDYLHGCEHSL